jgi:DNA polymerase-3 subunit epsilon
LNRIKFIEFIGNSILGHHVDFDVEMINAALEKLVWPIKKWSLDIDMMHRKLNDITDKQFSLNELSEIYKVQTPREIRQLKTLQNGFAISKIKVEIRY